MTSAVVDRSVPAPLTVAFDLAHERAVRAAANGLADPGLGDQRVGGPEVILLADAAVTSATPYLRAPLLARMSAVLRLHSVDAEPGEVCAACGAPSPCPTVQVLR
jgi:hypothetical protein